MVRSSTYIPITAVPPRTGSSAALAVSGGTPRSPERETSHATSVTSSNSQFSRRDPGSRAVRYTHQAPVRVVMTERRLCFAAALVQPSEIVVCFGQAVIRRHRALVGLERPFG